MKFKFLFFALLVAFLVACDDDENPNTFDFNIEEEFKIKQTYNSTRPMLSFTIIEVGDSRCPAGVYCVWQGEAKVTIAVEKPKLDTIILSSYNNQVEEVAGYEFKLIDLTPYPDINTEYVEDDVRIIMEISKEL